MNRDLIIGTAISLLLHGALAYWASTLVPTHAALQIEPKKLVRTVREEIVLPKKVVAPEPPKVEPPKPEPAAQAQPEAPAPVAKAAAKPKSEAPKPLAQKPSEPAPLVLSKTYGASDGSGVAVHAGKDDTLGDPNVEPDAQNTRQRFVPKVEAAATQGDAQGEGEVAGREVKIVRAVPKAKCRVEWPQGAEVGGRVVQVTLSLEIGVDGAVEKVRVLRGAGEPFDDAAIAAIRQCPFVGGTRDGKPFRDRFSFVVDFPPPR